MTEIIQFPLEMVRRRRSRRASTRKAAQAAAAAAARTARQQPSSLGEGDRMIDLDFSHTHIRYGITIPRGTEPSNILEVLLSVAGMLPPDVQLCSSRPSTTKTPSTARDGALSAEAPHDTPPSAPSGGKR